MGRYTGAKCKLCRREGTKLFLKGSRCYSDKCSLQRKDFPPGDKNKKYRRRQSDYAVHLREKQKTKRMYGLLEKQFKNTFKKAEKMKGVSGENLLKLLETRLDNVIYRMGYAPSRNSARQIVNHGHVLVDGKKVDIPSFIVTPGREIKIKNSSRQIPVIQEGMDSYNKLEQFSWLEVNHENFMGTMKSMPDTEQLPQDIDIRLIVEFYSQ